MKRILAIMILLILEEAKINIQLLKTQTSQIILDWAEMIMRMYMMWGEKNHYKVKTLDLQKAEPVGIKSITLEFCTGLALLPP